MNDHMSTAMQLAPLIERVHGAHHPELTRVRQLTEQINAATSYYVKEELFRELQVLTNNYELPADACEAFTGTYTALKAANQEHASSRAEV